MSRIAKFKESINRLVLISGRGLRIGNEERLLRGWGFLFDDENVLKSDCGDGCTTL